MIKKINLVLCIVLTVSILFFLYSIFTVKQQSGQMRHIEKIKLEREIRFLKEEIKLLQTNEFWAMQSEQEKINPELKLHSLQKDSCRFKDIVGSGKIILCFDEHDCDLCYKEIISKINQYIENFGSKNVIIIAHYTNARSFYYFVQNTKINVPIYYTTEGTGLTVTNAVQPFFFVMDSSFKAKYVFVPDKKYNENIETYFQFTDRHL